MRNPLPGKLLISSPHRSKIPINQMAPLLEHSERLDSWKEIAVYLKREVRTVRIWEKREGLPVYRHLHRLRGSVYAFRSELDSWWSQRSPGRCRDPIKLAVLPFKNLSCDAEQEFFSDGLTEEMITQLSRICPAQLEVIACTSAMHYKASNKGIDQIGRELNVKFVLQGGVRRADDRLRISAQLVDVQDQTTLWAESYERTVTDVFAIQCDVARRIAQSLKFELLPSAREMLTTRATSNPAAYEVYLKGRYYWNKRTGQGLQKAISYFEQAILHDTSYALAYSGLADTYILLAAYGLLPPADAMKRAERAAIKAVELDNSLAESHASLGEVKAFFEWDWSGAEREYQRAIELNPGYATGYHWYANFLSMMDRQSEALIEVSQATQLDPLSPIINVWVGIICYHCGQYDKAADQCGKALEIDPDYPLAHWALGLIHAQEGLYGEAIEELRKAVALGGGSTRMLAGLGHAYAKAGMEDEAIKIIDELVSLSKRAYVAAYDVATVYAGLNQRESSVTWLRKAYEEHSIWLPFMGVDPKLKNLHSDPSFGLLLERMGLPVHTNPA